MNITRIMKNSSKENWKKAFLQLLIHLFSNLAPLWLSLIVLLCILQKEHIPQMISNGQITIYSVAFLSTWISLKVQYLQKNNDRNGEQDRKNNYFLWVFNILFIVICSVFYALIIIKTFNESFKLDVSFIFKMSVILLTYSVLVLYYTLLQDQVLDTQQIINSDEQDEVDNIEKGFEEAKC